MSAHIPISNNRESYPVPIEKIIRLETCNGRTSIFTDDQQEHVFSYNIGEAEKYLTENFFRSHHSHIINMKHIKRVQRGRVYVITLTCNTKVPVAAQRVAEFRKRFFGSHERSANIHE